MTRRSERAWQGKTSLFVTPLPESPAPHLLRLSPGPGRAPALRPASPGFARPSQPLPLARSLARPHPGARARTARLARTGRAAAALAGGARGTGPELRGSRPSPWAGRADPGRRRRVTSESWNAGGRARGRPDSCGRPPGRGRAAAVFNRVTSYFKFPNKAEL